MSYLPAWVGVKSFLMFPPNQFVLQKYNYFLNYQNFFQLSAYTPS